MSAADDMLVFYDESIEIGPKELEKIVQSLVWLGDSVILPSYVRPDPRLPNDFKDAIRGRLAEFVDAGLVQLWEYEAAPIARRASWMPGDYEVLTLPDYVHTEISKRVDEATVRYRRDILRGANKGDGIGLDGITEFVTLRSAVWAQNMAYALGADHLLQLPERSPGPSLGKVATARKTEPVVKTLMEMHRIDSVWLLDSVDLEILRRKIPAARDFVSKVVSEAPSDAEIADEDEVASRLIDETRATYIELSQKRGKSPFGSVTANWTVSLLGLVHPVFTAFGITLPVVDRAMKNRRSLQVVTFMAELQRLTERAAAPK